MSIDLDENPALAGAVDEAGSEGKTPTQSFADKLAKRLPPNEVEHAAIKKARTRTRARAPRLGMHIEEGETGKRVLYSPHSDEDGHRYRLADAFGTRSMHFVYSMLKGLGKATEDHSENQGFYPGSPDQGAFNAALAIVDGVRPRDEIEAMLAAHMAVTNIALLELVARTRSAIAGHPYQGNGIKRLDALGNLTTKFMRTFTMQVEALARKRRKGGQKVTVKHVHVHAGGQAVVGNISHRGGRGVTKNAQQAHELTRTTPTISDSPSVRSADQEREALPVTSDEERTLSAARRRVR